MTPKRQEGAPLPDILARSRLHQQLKLTDMLAEDVTGAIYAAAVKLKGRAVAVNVLALGCAISTEKILKIEHPNITKVHKVVKLGDGTPAIIIDRPEGRPILEFLGKENDIVFPTGQVISAVLQLLSALHAVHQAGLTAKNLSANNLFIHQDTNGALRLKLASLGISGVGVNLKSPYYLSPERVMNADSGDVRSDIWAAGAILYHLCFGSPPHGLGDAYEIAGKSLLEEPNFAPGDRDVPQALIAVLRRALARDENHRYQSVSEMVGALMPLRAQFHEPMSEEVSDALKKSCPPPSPLDPPPSDSGSDDGPPPRPPPAPQRETPKKDDAKDAATDKSPPGPSKAASSDAGVWKKPVGPNRSVKSILSTTSPLSRDKSKTGAVKGPPSLKKAGSSPKKTILGIAPPRIPEAGERPHAEPARDAAKGSDGQKPKLADRGEAKPFAPSAEKSHPKLKSRDKGKLKSSVKPKPKPASQTEGAAATQIEEKTGGPPPFPPPLKKPELSPSEGVEDATPPTEDDRRETREVSQSELPVDQESRQTRAVLDGEGTHNVFEVPTVSMTFEQLDELASADVPPAVDIFPEDDDPVDESPPIAEAVPAPAPASGKSSRKALLIGVGTALVFVSVGVFAVLNTDHGSASERRHPFDLSRAEVASVPSPGPEAPVAAPSVNTTSGETSRAPSGSQNGQADNGLAATVEAPVSPSADPGTTSPAETDTGPATVSITLTDLPSEASIEVGDKPSENPIALPASDTSVTISVEAPGYEPYEVTVKPDVDKEVAIVMDKRETTSRAPTRKDRSAPAPRKQKRKDVPTEDSSPPLRSNPFL